MEAFYYKVFLYCGYQSEVYYTITTCFPTNPGFKPPSCPCDEKEYDQEDPVSCNLHFMGYRSYSATDELLEDVTAKFLKKLNSERDNLYECEIIGSNPLTAVKPAKK
uniref:Uncharacterized protein n=1 Tax=Marseillevirus LCMAC101 TaxID=2506602 RepID=A0A481YRG3_9VIRU|nr:MAG: hypothetical protein LCMAC101_04060 [Marseillevirus LCMAC101]